MKLSCPPAISIYLNETPEIFQLVFNLLKFRTYSRYSCSYYWKEELIIETKFVKRLTSKVSTHEGASPYN